MPKNSLYKVTDCTKKIILRLSRANRDFKSLGNLTTLILLFLTLFSVEFTATASDHIGANLDIGAHVDDVADAVVNRDGAYKANILADLGSILPTQSLVNNPNDPLHEFRTQARNKLADANGSELGTKRVCASLIFGAVIALIIGVVLTVLTAGVGLAIGVGVGVSIALPILLGLSTIVAVGGGVGGIIVGSPKIWNPDWAFGPAAKCIWTNGNISVMNDSSVSIGLMNLKNLSFYKAAEKDLKTNEELLFGTLKPYAATKTYAVQTISSNTVMQKGSYEQAWACTDCPTSASGIMFEAFVRTDERDPYTEVNCEGDDIYSLPPDCISQSTTFEMKALNSKDDITGDVTLSSLSVIKNAQGFEKCWDKSSLAQKGDIPQPCVAGQPCDILRINFDFLNCGPKFLSRAKKLNSLHATRKKSILGPTMTHTVAGVSGMPAPEQLARITETKELRSDDGKTSFRMSQGRLCMYTDGVEKSCTDKIQLGGQAANTYRVLSNGYAYFTNEKCKNLPVLSRLPALGPLESVKVVSDNGGRLVISGPNNDRWRGTPIDADDGPSLVPIPLKPFDEDFAITCVQTGNAISRGEGLKLGAPIKNYQGNKMWLNEMGSICTSVWDASGEEQVTNCTSPVQILGPSGSMLTPDSIWVGDDGTVSFLSRRFCPGVRLATFAAAGKANQLKIANDGQPGLFMNDEDARIWKPSDGFIFATREELAKCPTRMMLLRRGADLMAPTVLTSSSGEERLQFDNGSLTFESHPDLAPPVERFKSSQFIGIGSDGNHISADTLQFLSNGDLRVTNRMCPRTNFGSLPPDMVAKMNEGAVAEWTIKDAKRLDEDDTRHLNDEYDGGRLVARDDGAAEIHEFDPDLLGNIVKPPEPPVCRACAQAPNHCSLCLGSMCELNSIVKGDKLLAETGTRSLGIYPDGSALCVWTNIDEEGAGGGRICVSPSQHTNDLAFGINENGPYLTRSICPLVPLEIMHKAHTEKWADVMSMSMTNDWDLNFVNIFGKKVGSLKWDNPADRELKSTGYECNQSVLTKEHPSIQNGNVKLFLSFDAQGDVQNFCFNEICRSMRNLGLKNYNQLRILNGRLAFTNNNCPGTILGYLTVPTRESGNAYTQFSGLESFKLANDGKLMLLKRDGKPIEGIHEVDLVQVMRGIPDTPPAGSPLGFINVVRTECPAF